MNPRSRGRATATIVGAAREQRRHPTLSEETLWQDLRDRRLGGLKFRRQHPYGPYILDFYCVQCRLCVEVDGGVHLDAEQARHDADRADFLSSQGITILRFRNEELVLDGPGVLRKIAAQAAELAAQPDKKPER
jgi:very-short-patch-repair endonuclease